MSKRFQKFESKIYAQILHQCGMTSLWVELIDKNSCVVILSIKHGS
jgi:hypothetical protein